MSYNLSTDYGVAKYATGNLSKSSPIICIYGS